MEETNRIPGIYVTSDDGSEIEVITAGKMIIPVPEYEQNNIIYKLLEQNCDLHFYTNEKTDVFQFYPVPMMAVFAYDGQGNQYGTIGGIGDIRNDDYAVVFVSPNGSYGKLTNSFKEFLELVTFYPYWRKILEYELSGCAYDINEIDQKMNAGDKEFFSNLHEIASILKITKNQQVIQQLIMNIRSNPDFSIYNSKEDAIVEANKQ